MSYFISISFSFLSNLYRYYKISRICGLRNNSQKLQIIAKTKKELRRKNIFV